MALLLQRLSLNGFKLNLRTLSLASKSEKLVVTEVADFLPSFLVTENKNIRENPKPRTSVHYFRDAESSLWYTVEQLKCMQEKNKSNNAYQNESFLLADDPSFMQQKTQPETIQYINDILRYLEKFEPLKSGDQCHYHSSVEECHALLDNVLDMDVSANNLHIKSVNVSSNQDLSSFAGNSDLEYLKGSVMLCKDISKSSSKQSVDKIPGKPSAEQLKYIRDELERMVPRFFIAAVDYRIYNQKIIFENNMWRKSTVGLGKYATELMKVRFFAHIKYAKVKMQVLKITSHIEEGTIKVRWRVAGLSNTKAMQFWRYRPGKFRENINKDSQWTDGLSTFFIGGDGLVYKHRVDNVIPDDEVTEAVPVVNEKLAPVGFMSKTEIHKIVNSVLKKTQCDLS